MNLLTHSEIIDKVDIHIEIRFETVNNFRKVQIHTYFEKAQKNLTKSPVDLPFYFIKYYIEFIKFSFINCQISSNFLTFSDYMNFIISVISEPDLTTSTESNRSLEEIDSKVVEKISRLKNQQYVGKYSQTLIEDMKIIHWILALKKKVKWQEIVQAKILPGLSKVCNHSEDLNFSCHIQTKLQF